MQEGCRRIQNNDDDDDDDDWDADTRCYHDPLYIKHDYDKSKFYHTPGCTPPSSTCHGAPRRNIHMGHMTVSISLFEMRGVHTSQYQCKPHAERDRRLVAGGDGNAKTKRTQRTHRARQLRGKCKATARQSGDTIAEEQEQ